MGRQGRSRGSSSRTDVFQPACLSISTDSRDRVWIGFQGGGVAVARAATFQLFGERDGLPRGTVLGVLEDKSGAVWVGTSAA